MALGPYYKGKKNSILLNIPSSYALAEEELRITEEIRIVAEASQR